MKKDQTAFRAEFSGTLAPELELSARSQAHTGRLRGVRKPVKGGGDSSFGKADSPKAPSQP